MRRGLRAAGLFVSSTQGIDRIDNIDLGYDVYMTSDGKSYLSGGTTMITSICSRLCVLMIFSFGVAARERSDVGCYAVNDSSPGASPVQVCPEIFPRLWSADERRFIELTGYVAYVEDVPILFASKDIYLYSGGKGGVVLELRPPERERFRRLAKGEFAITVAGEYSPKNDSGLSSIGTLEVIGRHYWQQEMPGERPSLPLD